MADISLALLQIQNALKAFEPARLNNFRIIFVINQAAMVTSASAYVPAPALTCVELVNKTQLQWLLTHVSAFLDDMWRPQVTGALHRCIDHYDDNQGGYTVEYRQKSHGGKAMGRLLASY